MSTTAISSAPIYQDSTYLGKNTAKQQTKTLGQEEFLNLLITQLKNQDPLNPMQDKEFIAQLASFSSLEQTTKMNKNIEALIKQQTYLSASTATALIGNEITSNDNITGIVNAVEIDDNGIKLIVGTNKVLLSDVKTIKPFTA